MGINHQSLRSQKNCRSSEAMVNRPNKLLTNDIISPPSMRLYGLRGKKLLIFSHEAMIKHKHVYAASAKGTKGLSRGVHNRLSF